MRQILFIFLCFSSILACSQTVTVISNEDKQPLIGATFLVETENSESTYLTTDFNGKIKLAPHFFKGKSPVFVSISYIGFETKRDTLYYNQNKTISLKLKPYLVDDVIVTAQYQPTSIEKSVHKVRVISSKKIEDMAAVNLEDVLGNELNVRISQDNILGSGMSLQGISGQNVKFLIDGIPIIGRLDGQIDLNQINLNNIERIEIVEGPLSVNYGSNALAGTINIITKKEFKEKLFVTLNYYTENIGTYNIDASLGYSPKRNHSILVSGGRNYFDGWNAEDDFFPSFSAQRADSGRVKQWNPKEQYFGRVQYNYTWNQLLFSYKGEFFDEKISNLGFPRRTTTSFAALDDYYHTKRIDNALFASGKINKNLQLNWTAAYNDFERVKESLRKDLVTLRSNRIPESINNDTQDTSLFSLIMSRGSISTSFDSSKYNFEFGYDVNIEQASGKRIDGGEQEIGDYALFVSSELGLAEGFTVKPAVRYSYNTKYDAPLTPSINLKLNKKNRTYRFSYAKGFRAPSLKELYFDFDDINHTLFGNSNLKAERSNNFTAGVQERFLINETLLKAEFSGFYNKIFNQITFVETSTGDGDTLLYFNVGETKTKGLNARISLLLENIQLSFGASYIGRFNQLAEETTQVDDFSYSTEYTANLSYLIKKQNITIAIFAKHQGELPGFRYGQDNEIIKQTISSYRLVDATVSKKLFEKKLSISLGCKNIFNVQNVEANLSTGAHSVGGGSISVGTGRTVFVKLGMKLSQNR